MENDVLNDSPTRRSVRLEKESSKHRNIDASKDHTDASNFAISLKENSSKSLRKIDDFFVKRVSTTMERSERAQKSQVFDSEKMETIKTELEKIKNREMAAMEIDATNRKKPALQAINVKSIMSKQFAKKNPTKVVDKAFLINGKVYKPPRLPRPKHWATNRLYKFLWNCMEPKYKMRSRVKSEKFVQELANVVTIIQRRKKYENYKTELGGLMKEMAHLNIIKTRNDFYHFCQDYMPYEFRNKVVPTAMPGNKSNIPYDPEKLHIPILEESE